MLCVLLILCKKECPDKYALIFGALVGIPNFFSARFLLMALDYLPAVIVFPTFSVATILVVTLAGIGLFKAAQDAQRGGFSAAGRAKKRDKLLVPDV